jgi:hypothetical protein
MTNAVDGPGNVGPRRISDSRKTNSTDSEKVDGVDRKQRSGETRDSGDLDALVSRIKDAEGVRKNKVHEVQELMRNNELLTPEAIRYAAENLVSQEGE